MIHTFDPTSPAELLIGADWAEENGRPILARLMRQRASPTCAATAHNDKFPYRGNTYFWTYFHDGSGSNETDVLSRGLFELVRARADSVNAGNEQDEEDISLACFDTVQRALWALLESMEELAPVLEMLAL